MNNIYKNVTVENYNEVLDYLKSLGRPLTPDEMKLGKKAAEMFGQGIKNKVRASQENEIKFYMDRGFSLSEARVQVQLDEFSRNEYIGLGTSHKCRFPNRKRKFRKMNKKA